MTNSPLDSQRISDQTEVSAPIVEAPTNLPADGQSPDIEQFISDRNSVSQQRLVVTGQCLSAADQTLLTDAANFTASLAGEFARMSQPPSPSPSNLPNYATATSFTYSESFLASPLIFTSGLAMANTFISQLSILTDGNSFDMVTGPHIISQHNPKADVCANVSRSYVVTQCNNDVIEVPQILTELIQAQVPTQITQQTPVPEQQEDVSYQMKISDPPITPSPNDGTCLKSIDREEKSSTLIPITTCLPADPESVVKPAPPPPTSPPPAPTSPPPPPPPEVTNEKIDVVREKGQMNFTDLPMRSVDDFGSITKSEIAATPKFDERCFKEERAEKPIKRNQCKFQFSASKKYSLPVGNTTIADLPVLRLTKEQLAELTSRKGNTLKVPEKYPLMFTEQTAPAGQAVFARAPVVLKAETPRRPAVPVKAPAAKVNMQHPQNSPSFAPMFVPVKNMIPGAMGNGKVQYAKNVIPPKNYASPLRRGPQPTAVGKRPLLANNKSPVERIMSPPKGKYPRIPIQAQATTESNARMVMSPVKAIPPKAGFAPKGILREVPATRSVQEISPLVVAPPIPRIVQRPNFQPQFMMKSSSDVGSPMSPEKRSASKESKQDAKDVAGKKSLRGKRAISGGRVKDKSLSLSSSSSARRCKRKSMKNLALAKLLESTSSTSSSTEEESRLVLTERSGGHRGLLSGGGVEKSSNAKKSADKAPEPAANPEEPQRNHWTSMLPQWNSQAIMSNVFYPALIYTASFVTAEILLFIMDMLRPNI